MKRKITLSTLEELSGAISHNDLANYLGGGSGTQNDPFSFSEYKTSYRFHRFTDLSLAQLWEK